MTAPEASLIIEAMRQAPTLGAVLMVGYFGFKSYRELVGNMREDAKASAAAIAASTAAIMACTAAIERMTAALDAVPGKVAHEVSNIDHQRRMREAIGRG